MKIKIVLTSGKEIELTIQEYNELMDTVNETVRYTAPIKMPFSYLEHIPEITCNTFGAE